MAKIVIWEVGMHTAIFGLLTVQFDMKGRIPKYHNQNKAKFMAYISSILGPVLSMVTIIYCIL